MPVPCLTPSCSILVTIRQLARLQPMLSFVPWAIGISYTSSESLHESSAWKCVPEPLRHCLCASYQFFRPRPNCHLLKEAFPDLLTKSLPVTICPPRISWHPFKYPHVITLHYNTCFLINTCLFYETTEFGGCKHYVCSVHGISPVPSRVSGITGIQLNMYLWKNEYCQWQAFGEEFGPFLFLGQDYLRISLIGEMEVTS